MTNPDERGDPADQSGEIPDFQPFSDLRKFDFPGDHPMAQLGRTFRDGVARVDEVGGREAAKAAAFLGLAAIAVGALKARLRATGEDPPPN